MTAAPARFGITVPFDGVPLLEQRALFESLPDLGYTDVWSAESNANDAFTPLALASVWAPTLRLGTSIVPVYTRGPATLAMCAATMAAAAPGRFVLGVGSSSNVIVERWNAMEFDQPYQRVRDTVRFLRSALTGEKVTENYETFSVNGFRLGQAPCAAGCCGWRAGRQTARLSTGWRPTTCGQSRRTSTRAAQARRSQHGSSSRPPLMPTPRAGSRSSQSPHT
jgi:alkanesulfonate monooxygenase SsuD/methylene tetrahydromethanopterin reductase-like flavin-dependent oxidoreductase (luciferase family)